MAVDRISNIKLLFSMYESLMGVTDLFEKEQNISTNQI